MQRRGRSRRSLPPRTTSKPLAAGSESPQRVFFVGAGLSAAMHYPLGKHLVSRLMGYLRNEPETETLQKLGFANSLHRAGPDQERRAAEAKRVLLTIEYFLSRYLGVSPKQVDKAVLAEFYTLANSLAEMPALFGREDSPDQEQRLPIHRLYSALAAVTRSYFVDISQALDQRIPSDVRNLLDSLDTRRDAVVNFNWDEELDFFIGNGDIVYSLPAWRIHRVGHDRRFLILRPHGSTGWYDLLQGLANEGIFLTAYDDDRVPRPEKRLIAYASIELPEDLMNERQVIFDFPPVIMPPTFAKRFEYAEQLHIWQDVLDVCRNATEFVFLGYSLPPDDFLTRAAIRSAIQAKSKTAIRCLTVSDDDFTDERYQPFRSVFGEEFSADRNHLRWTFGCEKPGLPAKIKARLRDATITGRRTITGTHLKI